MATSYDIFISHAWADGKRPQEIAEALAAVGLRVWFDAKEINDFASITRSVTEGLAKSKVLLAYYSKTYPLRRACQWELTAAFLAAQTEGDPRHRVLLINPENGADHIYPIELRDSKFRNAPQNATEMRELTETIRNHVGKINDTLGDLRPVTARLWHGMTPVGSTRFVGRMAEMWKVHSLLHEGDVAQITGVSLTGGGIAIVSGLGGVGKSLLAEEYALRFSSAYPGGVFWLRAYGNDDSKASLGTQEREALRVNQVQTMAERLGVNTHGFTAEQIEAALAREMERRGKACLWVADDVPNKLTGDALRGWLAPHPLARTLITTRSREYGSLAKGIALLGLPSTDAYQLLTSRRKPSGEAEQKQARDLAEALGFHPLALDVTAGALVSYGDAQPFRKFREEVAKTENDALELAAELADALPNGHEVSIAQTMLRSIQILGEEAKDFLRLASVLAVAPIPGSMVTSVFKRVDGFDHERAEQRQRKAFHEVTAASLSEVAGEKQDARLVHTLVSRTVLFHDRPHNVINRIFRWIRKPRTELLRIAAIDVLVENVKSDGTTTIMNLGSHVMELISGLWMEEGVPVLSRTYLLRYRDSGELAFDLHDLPNLLEIARRHHK